MNTGPHTLLRIVGRGDEIPENGPTWNATGQSMSEESWTIWADTVWREVARVHALMDQVGAQMLDNVLERPEDSIRALETEAALRVLQAYYKGLRFAIDCQKSFARGQ